MRKVISKRKRMISYVVLLILCVLLALFCATSYRTFIYEYVEVKGISMEPTISSSGKKAKVQKNFYELKRNDIVVFFRSTNEEKYSLDKSPASKKNSFSAFCENLTNIFRVNPVPERAEYTCIIKRVIGVPGDTIQISDLKVYVNGELLLENYLNEPPYEWNGNTGVRNCYWRLKEDEYFILGDNRNYSTDSEDYGPIKSNQIYGKAVKISNL